MENTPDTARADVRRALEGDFPKRVLGRTGQKVSALAFGGFHLIETPSDTAVDLLSFYYDCGGRLVETAPSYGDSEEKIGRWMGPRRNQLFLSTKCHARGGEEARALLEESLRRLRTDHVDSLFMHNVQTEEDLKRILAPDGALQAVEKAKAEGKVRFVAVTSHTPEMLLKALRSYPFDFCMEWMNYCDRFNFPLIYDEIIPYCQQHGIGLMAMKPIGDGWLHASAEQALRWTLSLPVASVSCSNNNRSQLAHNITLLKTLKPMTDDEKERLYRTAPELGHYVCRQCGNCMPNKAGLDIPAIFRMEGYFDRQMDTGQVPDDTGVFALRERLKHWFGNQELARRRYAELEKKVTRNTDATDVESRCPYGLPITRKLKLAHRKLTGEDLLA